jgi:hypothetical protein
MAEARERRRTLVGEIEDIETQLGDHRKKVAMERDEWENWYQSAKWARVNRLQQLRELKDWMHDQRCVQPA